MEPPARALGHSPAHAHSSRAKHASKAKEMQSTRKHAPPPALAGPRRCVRHF